MISIKSVNGKEITSWNEFTQVISSSNGKELNLVVERDNKIVNVNVTPQKSEDGSYKVGVTCTRDKNIIHAI